ncbi:MAG TPA: hypothetical protein VNK52_12740 [Hyphomicrobiaceae bacterium]|nr:hypothetical protein [Hyphomicrobiaceae bacterium]
MRTVLTTTASALLLGSAAFAGAAEGERAGRYVLQPADGGGFVRLDTETGDMSLCTRKDTQWSCREMIDVGRDARAEADRLRAENKQLRAEIRRLEERLQSGTGAQVPLDPRRRPGERLQLPSEEDVDRAMTYLQRMFRKFRDKLKEFEDETHRGTPL